MKKSLEMLKSRGCEIDKAYRRCCSDEDFLLDCIKRTLDDPTFTVLGEAIKEKDADKIFDKSHYLKGAMANVGLDNLCSINDKIVEPSRKGVGEGLEGAYNEFIKEAEITKEIINKEE